MSSLKLLHSGGNGVIISAPSSNPAANRTITLNDTYAGDGSFVTANSSGNVGINKSNPSYPFVARRTDASGIIGEFANSSGYGLWIGQASASGEAYLKTGTGQSLAFKTNGDNERMRIDSSGNVGIGTTAINYPSGGGLTIYNATAPRLRLCNSSTGTGTHDGAEISIDNTTKDLYIENRESEDIIFYSGSERLRINDSGGLNHTSSTDNMITSSIAGAIRMQLTHTGGGDVNWANPSSGSAAYSTSSDYRLKQDVVDLPNAWSTVKALKPYEYKWKHNTSKTSQGFFAHEVIATAPNSQAGQGTKDAVDEDDKPIYQQIDYSKLVPVLTKALQEAITEIETLKTKVAALEAA